LRIPCRSGCLSGANLERHPTPQTTCRDRSLTVGCGTLRPTLARAVNVRLVARAMRCRSRLLSNSPDLFYATQSGPKGSARRSRTLSGAPTAITGLAVPTHPSVASVVMSFWHQKPTTQLAPRASFGTTPRCAALPCESGYTCLTSSSAPGRATQAMDYCYAPDLLDKHSLFLYGRPQPVSRRRLLRR
jgi:hypothetical protein